MKKLIEKILSLFATHAVWIFLVILVSICYLIYFQYLGQLTVRMWDESRNAINALEMLQNGNLLVTYYDGAPDMWNTKPPLLIWIIALFMKILGPTELALRLPSAISATLTVLVLFYFGKKYLKDIHIGLTGALILTASIGYAAAHIATSGDYDALLVLWVTIASLLYFIYTQDIVKNEKLIYPIMIAITLAILTKGIAGMLFLPGLFLYTLWIKKLKIILSSKDFFKALLIPIIVVFAYYFGREFFNPGYIKAVIENETASRYLNAIDSTDYGFWVYLEHSYKLRYLPWIFLLPFSALIGLLSQKKLIKQFSIFAIFYLTTFFLIISFSKTKQIWYDAPLYPIESMLIGASMVDLFNRIADKINLSIFIKKTILTFLILASISLPLIFEYRYIHRKSHRNLAPIVDYGRFLKTFTQKYPNLKEFSFMYEGYNAQVLFYVKAANYAGWKAEAKLITDEITQPEIILSCDEAIKNVLQEKYTTEILYSERECNAYIIK